MKVAIQGCLHGELDKVYSTIDFIQTSRNIKIDLLIICGDFQSVRNERDLREMACPAKFRKLGEFYEYYTGQKKAPCPTLFIGGNHEASNYLWELYHGGFVCPNIYFMGHAGVIKFGGLRIGGMSGIFKKHHYQTGYFETQPYNDKDCRSIYHVREYCVLKLAQVDNLDVMLSHDWPRGIAGHGNTAELLRFKKFLGPEIADNSLGSFPAEFLLNKIQPRYWFSAHLHVKFAALVNHASGKSTKFLALDKCLPGRDFLQVVDIDCKPGLKQFQLDPEWLAIVKAADIFFPKSYTAHLPSDEEFSMQIEIARRWLEHQQVELAPPEFEMTAPVEDTDELFNNPQTFEICKRLGIPCRFNPRHDAGMLEVNPEIMNISDSDD